MSLCLLRFPWSVQVDLHRSHYHCTCSCLDNLCLLGLSWVMNSVPHWSHAKETGFLHVTYRCASSSLLVSDDSFPQWLQVSDSSSKPGSRVTFQLGVPSRICFHTPCMDGSNAGFTIIRLLDSRLDPLCVLVL